MSDIVERLREVAERPDANYPAVMEQAADTITRLRAEVERLRAALREAYEVYAGSEGFIPETCGEGYQQQIIKQMVQIISAALEERT